MGLSFLMFADSYEIAVRFSSDGLLSMNAISIGCRWCFNSYFLGILLHSYLSLLLAARLGWVLIDKNGAGGMAFATGSTVLLRGTRPTRHVFRIRRQDQ